MVDYTLDERLGGLALTAVGVFMALAIFGFELISFEGILLNVVVVIVLIGGGLYTLFRLPYNNLVLLMAAVALIPLTALLMLGAGMSSTNPEDFWSLRLLMAVTILVAVAAAVDVIEELR